MSFAWAATITSNIVLFWALVYAKGWKRLSMFFLVQCVLLAITGIMIWGYYDPFVSVSDYHSTWTDVHILFTLTDCIVGWELLKKCPLSRWLCIGSVLTFVHAFTLLWQFAQTDNSLFYTGPQWIPDTLNLITTVILIAVIYIYAKEMKNEQT